MILALCVVPTICCVIIISEIEKDENGSARRKQIAWV